MNLGYAMTVLLVTAGMLLSALPLRRPRMLGVVTWAVSDIVNESPSLGLAYLLVSTLPALVGRGPSGLETVLLAIGCASFAVTPILFVRARTTRAVLERALHDELGSAVTQQHGWRTRLPWGRILLAPIPILPRGVSRRRGVRYGPHRRSRLDVYTGSTSATARPVLIHLHGGGFRSGRKSVYARPLLHAFARHGWVCVSASYRLRPARYTDMLADVRRVIAWTRDHAGQYGADPHAIVLAGSSAGAHLALTAALTSRQPARHPDRADTGATVAAAIGLYGYYGPVERGSPTPADLAHPDAPPIMIVHGAQDTLLPPNLHTQLVAALRRTSANPVVYAELPGAQHTFDLLHSYRFEQVIDALATFCWSVRAVRSDDEVSITTRSV